MSNLGTVLAKIIALTGGAFLGIWIGRWVEDKLSRQAKERSEHDRMRYAQGLAPLDVEPRTDERQG